MPRAAVDQLVYLLDESFEGIEKPWHSMLGNLASVTEDDWLWVPPDGARTIRTITSHVGGAVDLYYDRVFGNYAVYGEPITSWNVPAGNLGVGTEELDNTYPLENEPSMATSSPGLPNAPAPSGTPSPAWTTRPSPGSALIIEASLSPSAGSSAS